MLCVFPQPEQCWKARIRVSAHRPVHLEGQHVVEVASVQAKGTTLHIYQNTLRTSGQSFVARFFVKVGVIAILSLLFFGVAYGIYAPVTQAHQSSASVTDMINQVFGPDGPAATRVAQCESSLNPNAYNPLSIGGSHAEGIFQVLYPSTWAGTSSSALSPYDAMANISAAHEIFVRDGHSWREWVCQP